MSENAAISSVISRASAILLRLNDAIERAMKNDISNPNSVRKSLSKAQEQHSGRAMPLDSAVDYREYSSPPEKYMSAARSPYMERVPTGNFSPYPSRRSPGEISRVEAKSEAMLLGKIRDVLLELEEQLYRIQELEDDQVEERASASEEVDRKRNELVLLLHQHKGKEWQVVHEIKKFAGGGDVEEENDREYLRGNSVRPSGSRRVSAQLDKYRVSDIGVEGVIENLNERLDSVKPTRDESQQQMYQHRMSSGYDRETAQWQETEDGYIQDWIPDDSESVATDKGCSSKALNSGVHLPSEGGETGVARERYPHRISLETVTRKEEFENSEIHDHAFSDIDGLSVTAVNEAHNNEAQGEGEGEEEEDTDLGAVFMSLPGKALHILGDAAGHVASFSVKVAVVTLGVATIFSVGDKLIRAEKVRVRGVASQGSSERVLTKKRSAPAVLVSPAGKMQSSGANTPDKKGRSTVNGDHATRSSSHHPSHVAHSAHKAEEHKYHTHSSHDGSLPPCTIRERMEQTNGTPQQIGAKKKQPVYLARG